MNRLPILCAAAMLLSACQTSNGDQWDGPRLGTPYRQAEKTCLGQAEFMAADADRRAFFIGCMAALGWAPRPGATIDI